MVNLVFFLSSFFFILPLSHQVGWVQHVFNNVVNRFGSYFYDRPHAWHQSSLKLEVVLTTANAAGTNGLTCLLKHRNAKFSTVDNHGGDRLITFTIVIFTFKYVNIQWFITLEGDFNMTSTGLPPTVLAILSKLCASVNICWENSAYLFGARIWALTVSAFSQDLMSFSAHCQLAVCHCRSWIHRRYRLLTMKLITYYELKIRIP
jgi:hypothetical protein